MPHHEDRAGNKHRRIGPDDHTHEKRDGEVMQHIAAEEHERDEHKHDGERCNDRPRKHLVDTGIHELGQRVSPIPLEVLPDSVEDNHGIRQRVACKRKKCRDNEEVDLPVQYIEDAEHRQHVVQGCDGRGHTEPEFEAEGNIDDNRNERDRDCHECVALQRFTDHRANLHDAINLEGIVRELLFEQGLDFVGCTFGLPEPDQDLITPLTYFLDRRSLETVPFERGTRFVDRRVLLETELHRRAAYEVDAEVRLGPADLYQAHDPEHDKQRGYGKGDVFPPHKIDVGLMQDLKHFLLQRTY